MVKPIVVMSGSFNPPTIAHHKTMLAAVDTLDAELYYLIGSDNLAMFLRSKRLAEFLENFHFAVVVRDGDDTAPIFMANEVARARKYQLGSNWGQVKIGQGRNPNNKQRKTTVFA